MGFEKILTIDLEDWYQTSDLNIDPSRWGDYESRITKNTFTILDVFSEQKITATFYVLGYVAKQHPKLIKEISRRGHHIGSHGVHHKMVSKMTHDEFREDVKESKGILEDITGKEVNCFRAPSWSISFENLWALEILEEEKYICDSSLQPFKTPLSGERRVPLKPFRPVINERKLDLVEIPSSILRFGVVRIPFAGGAYLRMLPGWFICASLGRVSKSRPVMVYSHPWEWDTKQPRLKCPLYVILSHYANTNTTLRKLKRLLEKHKFVSVDEYLKENKHEYIEIGRDGVKKRGLNE